MKRKSISDFRSVENISYKRLRIVVQPAQTNGVERAKRFVNIDLYCMVSNLKRISKISTLPPLEKFLRTPMINMVKTQNWCVFPSKTSGAERKESENYFMLFTETQTTDRQQAAVGYLVAYIGRFIQKLNSSSYESIFVLVLLWPVRHLCTEQPNSGLNPPDQMWLLFGTLQNNITNGFVTTPHSQAADGAKGVCTC